MKLAVGLWDFLFGKEVPFEIPGPADESKNRKATEKWIAKKQHERQLEHLGDAARVHMLDGKSGYTILHWTIGEDIDAEAVEKFRDSETGDFYAMTHDEDGQEQTHLMPRHLWEEARRQMDEA